MAVGPLPLGVQEFMVLGVSDIQGCVFGFHLGGVDSPRYCSKELVWKSYAGELQEPGFTRASVFQSKYDFPVGWRRTKLDDKRTSQVLVSRLGEKTQN